MKNSVEFNFLNCVVTITKVAKNDFTASVMVFDYEGGVTFNQHFTDCYSALSACKLVADTVNFLSQNKKSACSYQSD